MGSYGYAMALTRNQAEAEDLVQETYVRAIRGAESLRAGSNVKNWLFTILRNIRLNQLRQQRTAPKFIELDADEGKTDIAIETSPDHMHIMLARRSVNVCAKRSSSFPRSFAK